MHVLAINFFQTGLCPFWLPHTVGDPRDPLFKLICHWHINTPHVALETRGVTLVVSCTLRLPRRYCIGEAD